MMNRSTSEWAFQGFLQLEVKPSKTETRTTSSSAPQNDVILLDEHEQEQQQNDEHDDVV